jgi:NTP pyrophosphatase (non-canonical NTP hydrolase)
MGRADGGRRGRSDPSTSVTHSFWRVYILSKLTFETLRIANITRLPLFKNRKGESAHLEPDGSDWALSAWANATMGELGEVSEALGHYIMLGLVMKSLGKAGDQIKKIERGDVTLDESRLVLADELADVQTYLDILAFRADIDLGEATVRKWNEVSERVDCPLRIKIVAHAENGGVVSLYDKTSALIDLSK